MKNNLLVELNDSMMNDFVSVNPEKNPVARALSQLNAEQLEYVIGQYSLFPENIVSFLLIARNKARAARCQDAATELTRNMGEELGTETDGVTHYEMLLRGLTNEFGKRAGAGWRGTLSSAATRAFVKGITKSLQNDEVVYVLGAIYAVECSAVPELRIVKTLVHTLASRVHHRARIEDSYFNSFFDKHLGTWEPGHEEGLRAVSPSYIKSRADQKLFEKGFKDVMGVMDTWWNGLAQEVTQK